MTFPPDRDRTEPARKLTPGFWFHDRLPLETETATFILVNVLDVFVTYLLLAGGGHREANPVARFFLDGWGVRGMIYYKLGMVAFVCVIAQVVAHVKPKVGRWLLIGLTAVVGAVVAYGAALLLRAGA